VTAYEPLRHTRLLKRGYAPETSGNENVDVTEATTPMIEKAKAIVSIIWTESNVYFAYKQADSNPPRTPA
jgi:hypothetical protein